MPARVRFDDLAAWLDWQQQLHPQAIEPGLARIARVAARAGCSPPACPVITVGGTNGKGSCVALLDAMLRAGGYRVGTFTSPHLVDYTERVRLQGRAVSGTSLICAFERIADALGDDTLTFFEFNTIAALLIFGTAAPDALILEVGMGGRLDAVNIVDADVAVIASIGIDHPEWLGADLESIAWEKAGIFRPGRPAVFGGVEPPPVSLVGAARTLGATLRIRGRDFHVSEAPGGRWNLEIAASTGVHRLERLPEPALAGAAQHGNAAAAIAALAELHGRLPLRRDAIESGLERVVLPGRFQRIADESFEWVLDVAHNPAAARVLAASLHRTRGGGRTIAVCGMLADKDVSGVLAELEDCVDTWIAAATEGARGLADSELAARAQQAGIAMRPGGGVAAAMELAARIARAGDRIVVFGSFHTVGPALTILEQRGVAMPLRCL
jgi:dihydrofolate synthase / folylpolyglutamate synthase